MSRALSELLSYAMNAGKGIDDVIMGRSCVLQGRRVARRAGKYVCSYADVTSLLSASTFFPCSYFETRHARVWSSFTRCALYIDFI